MLANMSLRLKLLMSFGLVVICLMMVAGISFWSLSQVITKFGHVAKVNLQKSIYLGEMSAAANSIQTATNRIGVSWGNKVELQRLSDQVNEALINYDKADKGYSGIDFVEGEKDTYEEVKTAFQGFMGKADSAMTLSSTDTSAAKEEYFKILKNELGPAASSYEEKIRKLVEFQNKKEAPKWVGMANDAATNGTRLTLAFAIIGVGVAVGVGFIISKSVAVALAQAADDLAEGSEQVSAASGQISSGSHHLSRATAEQAASLEETSASVQELSGMVESNVKNAESAVALSEEAMEHTQEGVENLDELLQAMISILESNKRIEGLVQVIEEIGDKTNIIDEIVFQTKLLSFNASVEAERAGEHGRGFAVVAQEVGNLAQMSGKAAMEISAIVKTSIRDAQDIALDNKTRVEKGAGLATGGRNVIRKLSAQSENVLTAARQIVNASKEQSAGLRQIGKAIDNLNQVTQQTASNSQEAASAAEELSRQAEAVKGVVKAIRRVVFGQEADITTKGPKGGAKPGKLVKLHAVSEASSQGHYGSMEFRQAAGSDVAGSREAASSGTDNGVTPANGSSSDWDKL